MRIRKNFGFSSIIDYYILVCRRIHLVVRLQTLTLHSMLTKWYGYGVAASPLAKENNARVRWLECFVGTCARVAQKRSPAEIEYVL